MIHAARAGSREAMGKVLQACRGYLMAIAAELIDPELRVKGGASDIVQETYMEAQRDFAQFRGSTEKELLGWLRQILRHNLANFTRRYRGTGKRDIAHEVRFAAGDSSAAEPGWAGDEPTPSAVMADVEQAARLQLAVGRLGDEYRDVLRLRFEGEMSFEEIGHKMGRSAEAARKLWTRAMDRLREVWESME